MQLIGERLRMARRLLKLTQKDVAKITGLKQNQISDHETGTTSPGADTVRMYADCYKTTADYLLGRTDDPSPPMKTEDPPGLAYLMARQDEFLSPSEARITEEERVYLRQAPGSFSVSGYLILLRIARDQLEQSKLQTSKTESDT